MEYKFIEDYKEFLDNKSYQDYDYYKNIIKREI